MLRFVIVTVSAFFNWKWWWKNKNNKHVAKVNFDGWWWFWIKQLSMFLHKLVCDRYVCSSYFLFVPQNNISTTYLLPFSFQIMRGVEGGWEGELVGFRSLWWATLKILTKLRPCQSYWCCYPKRNVNTSSLAVVYSAQKQYTPLREETRHYNR